MTPKISIITVTYNNKILLEKTIKNIIAQSFKYYEYIIIDGNSSDGSQKIINKYKHQISFWSSEPDDGIYDAMNKGLRAASGDYIIFMNAGDTFFNQNTLANIPFNKFPEADIFYGETMIVNENGQLLGLRQKKLPLNLTWKHFKRGMVVCHQSVIIRRSIAPFFKPEYKFTADIDWVLTSLKKSSKNIFTDSIISNFMVGGFSSQTHKKSLMERFTILNHHFGLCQNILSHIGFIIESLLIFIKIKPKLRKPDSKFLKK